MAFPTVESVTETAFASGTSHNVSMPATVNSGDLLITLFGNDSNATVTTPSGWTLIDNTVNGTDPRFSSYYRIADGSEDGTTVDFVTSADEAASAQVYRISGWHGTTAPEIGTPATGSSAAPDPSSTTPSWGAADTLWIATAGWNRDRTVSAYPTNYTGNNTDTVSGAGAGGVGVGSATRDLNATSDDPGTFTISASDPWISYTIAVRPGGTTDRRYQMSFAEFELPNEPRRYQLSWAELEVPNEPRRYQLSWAELEVPNEPRRYQLSWAELETPDGPADRRYQMSFAELEIPEFNRRYQLAWAELEVPADPAAPAIQFQRAAYPGVQAPY